MHTNTTVATEEKTGGSAPLPAGKDRSAPQDIGRPSEMRSRFKYMDLFEGFSPDEIRTICEVKRFFECYEGDRDFRKALDAGGQFTDEQRQMLKDIGVTFEPEAMAPLWQDKDLVDSLPSMVVRHADFDDLPSDFHERLAPWPEMKLWLRSRFRSSRSNLFQKLLASGNSTGSPEYTAWRGRRVAAVRNELGEFGWALDHPCHAVEMAVGCSVGCGFCAFDAPRLQTVFDLTRPENRALLASVAAGMTNALGWPASHGMLYWSTEPHDNPHYVEALKLWEKMTGSKLCTATARAGEDWMRELLDYYGKEPVVPWPRVSVLTRSIMRRLHKTFTPLELRDATLLMQQKDAEAIRGKVPGGRKRMLRQLIDADDLRNVDFENLPEGFSPPQGTIACVSGFLVNMVNRTLQLMSPCYTTMEYQYGYRVFDETTFGDGPEGFEVALRRMVKRSMVVRPYAEMPMRWRDDLKVVMHPEGFTTLSPTTRRDFRRGELHVRTAELMNRGDLTYGEMFEMLSDNLLVGPMAAMAMLDSLFDKGYLCELAITRDYRARQEAEDASLREPEPMAA